MIMDTPEEEEMAYSQYSQVNTSQHSGINTSGKCIHAIGVSKVPVVAEVINRNVLEDICFLP